MDSVVALPRYPAADRRRPGRALSGPRSLPSTRREASTTAARRSTPSSSRPSARSRASTSSISAPGPAIIARSWPSWSAVRPGHGGRVRRGAGRTGQDLLFRPQQCPHCPWRRRTLARNLGRRGLRQFRRFSAGGSLDREPRTRRPAGVPARRARPAAAEFRRPAQRPRRGAQDRATPRGRSLGVFCLRRRRIRGRCRRGRAPARRLRRRRSRHGPQPDLEAPYPIRSLLVRRQGLGFVP